HVQRDATPTPLPYTTLFRSLRLNKPDAFEQALEPWTPAHRIKLRFHVQIPQPNRPLLQCPLEPCERLFLFSESRMNQRMIVWREDRKSTRLNSSHQIISYAV